MVYCPSCSWKKLRTITAPMSDVVSLPYDLELQPPTHRDNASALLWAGRLSEVGVSNRAVHTEICPIEQVEDVETIDKPNTAIPGELELLDYRDVLREDRRLPESSHELRSAPKLELARNAEGS